MYQFALDSLMKQPYTLAAPQGVNGTIFENQQLAASNWQLAFGSWLQQTKTGLTTDLH
jgi:hypothetical protein